MTEGEDFYIVDDLDLADESALRRVVAEVEALVGGNNKGLRVSVLSATQWQTVLRRYLPAGTVRRGAERYTHVIRDRRDPQHLLVSPSAVQGINERQRTAYQELIYALLRCLPTTLDGPLRRGVDDIVAAICSQRVGVSFFCRTRPAEATLTRAMIRVLMVEHGYTEQDWALELRKNPEKVLRVLAKTKFAAYWLNLAKQDEETALLLEKSANKRQALFDTLHTSKMNSSFVQMTEEALENYLAWAASQKKRKPKETAGAA